jgi:AbiU2
MHCGDLFQALRQETGELWVRWKIYRGNYSEAPATLDIWNLTGTGVFTVLQTILFEDMVVRLCRLTEPDNAYDNLSIRKLTAALREADPVFVEESLEKPLAALLAKCEVLREVRNRRLAHVDLERALRIERCAVSALNRDDVEGPMRMLAAYLNLIEGRYLRSKTFYTDILVPLSEDGQQLSALLQEAAAVKSAEQQ